MKQNKLTKRDLSFIQFVKRECRKYGIKCDLRATKYVKFGNIRCSGWFDSEGRQLVVAFNRPDALSILAHEYAHLTQWQDSIAGKFPLWDKSATSLIKVDDWLSGVRVRNIQRHLAIARDLELDNEKRTVKLIQKFKLNIDIRLYIQKANAYAHFYNWLWHSRRWSRPGNAAYENDIILNVMSSKFNMKYTQMSKRVYNAFNATNI